MRTIQTFSFQGSEEILHRSVIIGTAGAGHRGRNVVCFRQVEVCLGSVLRPLVTVECESISDLFLRTSILQQEVSFFYCPLDWVRSRMTGGIFLCREGKRKPPADQLSQKAWSHNEDETPPETARWTILSMTSFEGDHKSSALIGPGQIARSTGDCD